ncbi:meprin A subunit beta-like isoform X2 [Oculina patagonica]
MTWLWFLVVLLINIPCSEMKPTDTGHNKEYETPRGHVPAENMAQRIKRAATTQNITVNGSAFDQIEKRKTGGNVTVKVNESAFEEITKANKGNLTRLYQGDIVLDGDTELQEYIKSGGNSRNAQRSRKRLWTSRTVPLLIPSFMSHIRTNVRKAMNEFNRKTCLRFVDYVPGYHKNYITFDASNGCSSRIGKKYFEPGRQTISIGNGCNALSTVIHELMHAIGFFHEQARSDRDKYVKIYWENIVQGFSDQFDKYNWRDIDMLGVSYDYQSIMHYNRKAFSKNGKPTIVAIGNENMEFKSPNGKLSTRDAIEINALYDCKTKTYGWTSWSGWTPCDDNCFRTRERFCYNSGDVTSCRGDSIYNTYGVDKQKEKCPSSICPAPVNGHWSRWSEWQPCSKTCDEGVRTRTRKCNNPPPAHAGKPCPGSASEQSFCIMKRCVLDSDDTDFENFRLGMWKQSKLDVLDWYFQKGITQTADTGPDRDHTSGSGYYLYVESSWPRIRAGQKADLISPWMNPIPGGQCLKFYYTMYGRTMGSLDVKLELSDGRAWLIFLKKGDQGKDWKKGQGNIDIPAGLSYRLVIEGRIGQPGYSDIAIDDVYIDPGLCSK